MQLSWLCKSGGTPCWRPHLTQVTVVSVELASVSLLEQEGRHILPWRAPRYRRPIRLLFMEVQLARQLQEGKGAERGMGGAAA